MKKQYYLVTGTCVAEVERLTGLRAIETHLGTLVELPPEPPPYSLQPFVMPSVQVRRDYGVINMTTVT